MKQLSHISRRLVLGLVAGLMLVCLATFGLVVGARTLSDTPLITQEEHVASTGADLASVTIEFPSGILSLGGGGDGLLDAGFQYSDPAAEPLIQYDRRENVGTLLVRQPQLTRSGVRRAVNRWQVHLNRQIPLDLMVSAGTGVHSLDLRSLSLQNVEIGLGEDGVMSVNLGGYWPEDVDVSFHGGNGLLVITLPQGMGARVELDKHDGEVTVDGASRLYEDSPGVYVNDLYETSVPTMDVRIVGHRGETTLRAGVPGDLPVGQAIGLAKLVYSKQGAFDCGTVPDDGQYLPTDMVKDLWYDYLCERGPQYRNFDGDDPLSRELAAAEMVDQIRREYYEQGQDIADGTMKFNMKEFMSATMDMLLKARQDPSQIEFSLTHFMGSFSYSVQRVGDRLHFTIENQTDLASGTHLPLRFPDAGYTQSLEALVAQEPHLADAFLLELVQSNRYPIISVLEAKDRQETAEAEGGGNFRQTFTWSEPYLPEFEMLPPWPGYVSQLDIR